MKAEASQWIAGGSLRVTAGFLRDCTAWGAALDQALIDAMASDRDKARVSNGESDDGAAPSRSEDQDGGRCERGRGDDPLHGQAVSALPVPADLAVDGSDDGAEFRNAARAGGAQAVPSGAAKDGPATAGLPEANGEADDPAPAAPAPLPSPVERLGPLLTRAAPAPTAASDEAPLNSTPADTPAGALRDGAGVPLSGEGSSPDERRLHVLVSERGASVFIRDRSIDADAVPSLLVALRDLLADDGQPPLHELLVNGQRVYRNAGTPPRPPADPAILAIA